MNLVLRIILLAVLVVLVVGAKKKDDDYEDYDDDYDYGDDVDEPETLPPTQPTPKPTEPTPKPNPVTTTQPTTKPNPVNPTQPTPKPVNPTTQPTAKPVNPTTQPTPKPVNPTTQPTPKPVNPTQPTPKPVNPTQSTQNPNPNPTTPTSTPSGGGATSTSTVSPTSPLLSRCKLAHASDDIQSVKEDNTCVFYCVGARRQYRHRKDNGDSCGANGNDFCIRGKCRSETEDTQQACKSILNDQNAYGIRGRNKCAVLCAKGTDRLKRFAMPSTTICSRRRGATGHCQNFRCRK